MNVLSMPFRVIRWVMDPRVSPLRHLPLAQRFQAMCALGMMWTLVFCLGTFGWYYYASLATFHAFMALGVLVTGVTFSAAAQSGKTYRDHPLPDGSARYDDVWGG